MIHGMSHDQRRAKVTAEHIGECRRLRALWEQTKEKPSQAVFGERYGIGSQSAVGQFLSGITPLSLNAAQGFAKGLNCQIEQFSPRLAAIAQGIAASINPESDEFVYVKHANISFSAGHGAVVYEDGQKSSLSFRRDYLRGQGVSEKNAVVVDVKGHSMEPLIADGSVLLVSTAHQTVTSGQVYAFRSDGQLYVKKLFVTADGYLAQSENPDKELYPDVLLKPGTEDFEMVGRAVWMGKKL